MTHKFLYLDSTLSSQLYIEYLTATIVLSAAFVYSLYIAPSIESATDGLFGRINNMHKSCIINCDTTTCKKVLSGRGSNYFINTPKEKQEAIKSCVITFWGLSHFACYAVLGFLAPNIFQEAFVIGAWFEFYEHEKYDCHDPLDILLNIAGYTIGSTIRSNI